MESNFNPAGSEAHEVCSRIVGRLPHRLFRDEGSIQSDCAEGRVVWGG